MDVYIGNIAIANLSRLERASAQIGVSFRKGAMMTLSGNDIPDLPFTPIFCETREDGSRLIKSYVLLAHQEGDLDSLEEDLVPSGGGISDIVVRLGLGESEQLK